MNAEVISESSLYGSKGQAWHPNFVEYMKFIVLHPNYAGMPDAIKADGRIQWEAPSNRGGGLYKDTHHKRRNWWREKGESPGIGIFDGESQWISRVAKVIHPTGSKPCKRCGNSLRIAYVYPSRSFVSRCIKAFGEDYAPGALEEVASYMRRIVDSGGVSQLRHFSSLFKTKDILPPQLGEDLDSWLEWVEEIYVPSEPTLLSPGVMSNAPDRLDGFHSFNRCCRGEADTGRHKPNMQCYTTDRRVFEYWSEGDWIAADRMMGLVRARFASHSCADGGMGPPSADHIGPLSLGFAHLPEFRLLSKSANSAKNNRMTFWDVGYLREQEARGVQIVSWYAAPIWSALKDRVVNEETALRLSKIMRDNQRQAMYFLAELREKGHAAFLGSFLELDRADFNVEFEDLKVVNFVTSFSSIMRRHRTTKYASEQKARRMRIGFEALRSYSAKTNRHFWQVRDASIEYNLELAHATLRGAPNRILELDKQITMILDQPGTYTFEEELRSVCASLPKISEEQAFTDARSLLQAAMQVVADILVANWENERYVRVGCAVDESDELIENILPALIAIPRL
ncbi:Alw26I/Eco31I/Esp3I family type II restriction endonuclease [Pseudomonas promysalinigenes]|uniref:Alw26I/Eco31I/Esp3I family type II restriction endonuclease n=1 Tax=Pseudomonas promysalinigenes TaxID=485898 RepID=UPI0016765BA6|nr:Alw26I/Eco31I/Esp3I family type II restriction endonuclease [Pseudomonas promysalinigenes]QXI34381.1 Alw26I/Eco31I/Esp3I family type II restriction endonuclease [Pseudomonas promysalinigenes]